MKTESQWREHRRIKVHGEHMRLARIKHGTHIICPDCYRPRHLCPHVNLKEQP